MTRESIVDFLSRFESLARQKNFDLIAELIHENAIFRFNDGDFLGRAAIRAAFEKSWASSGAADEKFFLSNINVLVLDQHSAAATYDWTWSATLDGKPFSVLGRGTRVLVETNDRWQILHEHLSRMPKRE